MLQGATSTLRVFAEQLDGTSVSEVMWLHHQALLQKLYTIVAHVDFNSTGFCPG